MENPIIEVSEGKLQGTLSNTVNNLPFYKFKGIPYAKPPIGSLRFCIPQPPEPWEGIRDATKDSNICAQFDKATNTILGSEDCLFLNVYTPKLPLDGSSLLPVMVFFHGGGFLFGNGTIESIHGPDYLIEKDVVVVSFNYRVGILGFLSLGLKEAPGNMGLRDQVQVLKWIKQNISRFGGDPANVTLFGFSAGAASVEYLLLSPMARGLFHKAIAQSGSTLSHWAQSKNSDKLAREVGFLKTKTYLEDEELLVVLKEITTKELISLSMKAIGAAKSRGGLYFGFVPVIEQAGDWDPFLNESTYKLLTKGDFPRVPYLAGFCSKEGLIVTAHSPNVFEKLKTEKVFLDHLPFDITESDKTDMESKLKGLYLDNKENSDEGFAVDFFTDVDFLGSVCTAAKFIAKNNNPVYLYEFSHDGELNYLKKKLNIKGQGASHGDEGGYLIRSEMLPNQPLETDKLVRQRLVHMWTSFAKNGDPTTVTDELIAVKWEPLRESSMPYLFINSDLQMKYDPYPERVEFFQNLYEKYY